MGFFEYLDAHPWWALIYIITIGFFVVLAVAIRRDYTATEMMKVLTNAFQQRGQAPFQPPDIEPKGPRPLNG